MGYTNLNVLEGGTLSLIDTTVSGGNAGRDNSWVQFQPGAQATVTGCDFSIYVIQYSGTKAAPLVSFSGNTFQHATPLYTYGALVEDFTDDNTFNHSGGLSSIYIQGGTLTEDASWHVSGTATRYVINNHFTVGSGTTLNVQPGVEIYTLRYSYNDYIYDFNVNGTVNVAGAAFVGYTDLNVLDGGTLNLYGATLSGGNAGRETSLIDYRDGSMGHADYSQFVLPVSIHSDAYVEIYNNDFAAGSVVAVGDPADTIDLRWNWWGSTNPVVIGNKITDQLDDAARPLVLIEPWLPVPPTYVPTIADILDVTPDPRDTSVDEITITFSRPIQGFGIDDLQLDAQWRRQSPDRAQSLLTTNDMVWTLTGLSAITEDLGIYQLHLDAAGSGIYDPLVQPLQSDADDFWWNITSPLEVSTAEDGDDGIYTPGNLSLREALALSGQHPGPETITFAPALIGETITLTEGELVIDSDVDIQGPGAANLTIDAGSEDRVFYVNGDAVQVALDGVTLIAGESFGPGINGLGIYLRQGDLAISNAVISGDSSTAYCGGGIYNSFGTLTITSSTITGNSAQYGGAIFSRSGTVTVTSSTLLANAADIDGGAIYLYDGILLVDNSAVVANTADGAGGGIYQLDGFLAVSNSTIAGNLANEGGGIGILSASTTLNNTIVALNAATLARTYWVPSPDRIVWLATGLT